MISTVLLVETNEILRKGLSCKLAQNRNAGLRILECASGQEALRVAARESIDVAIVGCDLPDTPVLEIVGALAGEPARPTPCIAILKRGGAGRLDPDLCKIALGLLGDSATAADLCAAVDAVSVGRRYLSPSLGEDLLASSNLGRNGASVLGQHLTARERCVLRHIGEGFSNREIGTQLGISKRTVDTYRLRLMRKLGMHKTAGLVRAAVREGLVAA